MRLWWQDSEAPQTMTSTRNRGPELDELTFRVTASSTGRPPLPVKQLQSTGNLSPAFGESIEVKLQVSIASSSDSDKDVRKRSRLQVASSPAGAYGGFEEL